MFRIIQFWRALLNFQVLGEVDWERTYFRAAVVG